MNTHIIAAAESTTFICFSSADLDSIAALWSRFMTASMPATHTRMM